MSDAYSEFWEEVDAELHNEQADEVMQEIMTIIDQLEPGKSNSRFTHNGHGCSVTQEENEGSYHVEIGNVGVVVYPEEQRGTFWS